jgi:hypothetical protein
LSERALQTQILIKFGCRPGLRLWRQNSGLLWAKDGRRVRATVIGAADISGILRRDGRRLEIEVKSPTGRQSPEQKAFQAMIEAFGGKYILARSIEDVERELGGLI